VVLLSGASQCCIFIFTAWLFEYVKYRLEANFSKSHGDSNAFILDFTGILNVRFSLFKELLECACDFCVSVFTNTNHVNHFFGLWEMMILVI